MTEEPESTGNAEGTEFSYELKSVKEAAQLLRVSESTVWRYADQDILPAYRVGPKRVMFRRGDLDSLLRRVRRKKEQPVKGTDRLRLFAMNEGVAATGAAASARARNLREEILSRRGGVVVSESWRDIADGREERSAGL